MSALLAAIAGFVVGSLGFYVIDKRMNRRFYQYKEAEEIKSYATYVSIGIGLIVAFFCFLFEACVR